MNSASVASAAPSCPGPNTDTRRPRFILPKGSWDSMAHIFGPFDKFPLSNRRSYTPEECPLERYLAHLDRLGFEYGVLVQGGAHSTDNRAMLDALRREPQRLRGVAVVPPGLSEAERQEMHILGVRGVRMSTVVGGSVTFENLPRLAEEIAPLGWHAMLHFLKADELLGLEPYLERCPVDVVFDHMARITGAEGVSSEPFKALLRYLGTGRCWVRLSSLYRLSSLPHPYDDMLPMIEAVLNFRPDRVLWGSNWPHPILWDKPMPNDADLVDLIPKWIPLPLQKKVLVENPLALYR